MKRIRYKQTRDRQGMHTEVEGEEGDQNASGKERKIKKNKERTWYGGVDRYIHRRDRESQTRID